MFSHSAHWGCLRTLAHTTMPIGGRAYVSFTVCIAASVRPRALQCCSQGNTPTETKTLSRLQSIETKTRKILYISKGNSSAKALCQTRDFINTDAACQDSRLQNLKQRLNGYGDKISSVATAMHDAIISIKDVMFTLDHLFPFWKAAGESETPKDSIKVELFVPILLPNAVEQFLRSVNHQKPKEIHP